MNDKTQQPTPEPSLDDILSSIRKILSENEGGYAGGGGGPGTTGGGPLSASGPAGTDRKSLDPVAGRPVSSSRKTPFFTRPFDDSAGRVLRKPASNTLYPGYQIRSASPSSAAPTVGEKHDAGHAVAPDEAVFDLTEDMLVSPGPSPKGNNDDGPVFDLTDDMMVNKPLPPDSCAPAFSSAPQGQGDFGDRLLSEGAAEIATHLLSDLASQVAKERHVLLGQGAVTLETMVRDILRDLLRGWLDKNLPGITERLVKKEIERLVADVEQG